MKILTSAIICSLLIFASESFSQDNTNISKRYSTLDLKNKLTNSSAREKEISITGSTASGSKSPALALLFSLILPGAGHYYINRMDVGKYFLGADALSWAGLVSLNIYGDGVRDDSRTYSVDHAQVKNKDGKDDDFFTNIGSYSNVYEYNNDKLQRGEYYLLYDVNSHYWNWDNLQNQKIYETQRKNSEEIYNSRIIFGSLLIANRIVSGISAYLLANKKDKKSSSFNILPEILYKGNYSFDGLRFNLSKNF